MSSKQQPIADRSESVYSDDKRAVSQDEFVLERVQGLTGTTLQSLASNPVTGWVAFPAACVLVLFDPKTNEQKFIESPSLKNISCCTFSEDGRLIAFSETGMKPHIAIWNLRDHRECHKFMTNMTIRGMYFHPTNPIIISLCMKDTLITVWDYVKGMRMASCKWQTVPLSLTIPLQGTHLLVCGHRKITLFNISKVSSCTHETNVFEDRKTVLLGKQSEYTFIDIESGRGKHERTVYTVTLCGYLCGVKLGDILIDKAIKVDQKTFCVRYSSELLFVGCQAGVVKICDPDNLTVTAAVSLGNLLGPSALPKVGSKGHLDVCTLVVDENEKIVTCVYADCSMHSWQIGTDGEKIVCSAIEPNAGLNDVSKSNLLRSFIGCCENKGNTDFLSRFSLTDQTRPPMQYGNRCLVNENRAYFQNANAVRFTPDGKDVICGNEEGEIKVYELSTGILRRVIEAHSSQVTCIELMYDNDFQLVCSGGRDRVMFVLDARNDFSLVQVLCDHSAAITTISLVNNNGVLTLVSAAADNVILIRRAILGGTLRFTITGEIAQTNTNRSFFVTSDYIALGGKDSQIKVFKADPVFVSKPVKTINCQKLSPNCPGFKAIDIDPSGSFMAVSQTNGNISVYHLQTGQPVASLPLQSDMNSIQFTPDLKYMVSSTSNGCDLVWRLPERMTEFMRSKQEKTYQIETNNEVTYETYMSCVKITKEEDDEVEILEDQPKHHDGSVDIQIQRQKNPRGNLTNSPIVSNLSNHHTDDGTRTPSIDSMTMLDKFKNQMLCNDNGKTRKTGAGYLAPTHAAGVQIEGEESFEKTQCSSAYGSDSILSCSTCTHSLSTTTHTSCCSAVHSETSNSTQDGIECHKRFYCGADNKLFGQVIEEGTCVKVGPFRETGLVSAPSRSGEIQAHRATYEATENQSNSKTLSHNEALTPEPICCEKLNFDERENQQTRIDQLELTTEPLGDDKTVSGEAMPSEPKDTLDECNYEDAFSEDSLQTQSQNQDLEHILTPPMQPEIRHPMSKKIMERTCFYENLIKGDKVQRPKATSPSRQESEAVADAVRSAIQRSRSNTVDPHQPAQNKREEASSEDKEAAEGNEKEPSYHWTPLTTPEFSNTSSNITNLVPNCSSTIIVMEDTTTRLNPVETSLERKCSPTPYVNEVPTTVVDVKQETEDLAEEEKACSNTAQDHEENDPTEIFEDTGFQSNWSTNEITHNEMEVTCARRECTDQNDGKTDNGSATPSIPDKEANIEILINCSGTEVEELNQERAEMCDTEIACSRGAVADFQETFTDESLEHRHGDGYDKSNLQGKTLIEALEQNVPEQFRNALRSCMQLSNSQETFATLRVDTNDLELMPFLSETLKKKLVAAGLVGLSHNEIDKLLTCGGGWNKGIETMVATATPSTSSTKLSEAQAKDSNIEPLLERNALVRMKTEVLECLKENIVKPNNPCDKSSWSKSDQLAKNIVKPNYPCDKSSWSTSDQLAKDESERYTPCSVSPSMQPSGEQKKGLYRSIINRFCAARRGQSNKSSNRNIMDVELLEEVACDPKFCDLFQEEIYLGRNSGDRFEVPTHSDTYINDDTLRGTNTCCEEKPPSVQHAGGPISEASRSPTKSTGRRESPHSLNTGLDSEQRSITPNRTKLLRRSQNEGDASNKSPKKPINTSTDSRSATPKRELGSVEERDLKRVPLKEGVGKRRRVGHFHLSRNISTGSEVNRGENRDSLKSRAASLESTTSKDICATSGSDSGVDARGSYREKPIVERFRDQDEYLRKLKEVRENFERSIQALSQERKSRQAAEARK